MLFDIYNKKLYTDKGELIKSMFCPIIVQWSKLEKLTNTSRLCLHCKNQIIDTAHFNEDELLEMAKVNPSICFKLNLNQENLNIIIND